jgi:hypothetical protein
MKNLLPAIGMLFLTACNSNISATEELPNQDEPLGNLAEAIESKDFRLFAFSGKGMTIPGIKPNDVEHAAQMCGVRYVPNTGDVIREQSEIKSRKLLFAKAERYNKTIYQYCVKQNSAFEL